MDAIIVMLHTDLGGNSQDDWDEIYDGSAVACIENGS
jgi:hypothetical protein